MLLYSSAACKPFEVHDKATDLHIKEFNSGIPYIIISLQFLQKYESSKNSELNVSIDYSKSTHIFVHI